MRHVILVAVAMTMLLVGFAIGRQHVPHTMTNASYRTRAGVADHPLDGYVFHTYGDFSASGRVIAIWDDVAHAFQGMTRIVLVDDPDAARRTREAYEVHYDRGVYQVHVNGTPLRFTVLCLAEATGLGAVHLDDRLAVSGEYGEISYPGGAYTSLPDLGSFVCAVRSALPLR